MFFSKLRLNGFKSFVDPTELRIEPVSMYCMICFAAISAQLSSASAVDAPRCGMQMNLSWCCMNSSAKSQMYLPTCPFL